MLTRFFTNLYRRLIPHRPSLFAATALLLAFAALACRDLRLQENIAAMLPDDQSAAAVDFKLLQQSPFARKVIISLYDRGGIGTERLQAAADRFAAALPGEELSRVVSGPADLAGDGLVMPLVAQLPLLMTADDLQQMAAELSPNEIARRLQHGYERMLLPEGWGMQALLRSDPLELYRFGLGKLGQVNLVPRASLQEGHFASADGRHLLIIADTPVAMTDSAGARRLVARIETAAARLPDGVTVEHISGHRYTLANAEAIKGDLAFILGVSSLLVLLIYVGFLRSRWALFVFLIPSSVLLIATALLQLTADQVFALTIGFGGVLLGIADEYAMNVYFACRRAEGDPAPLFGAISRPVLFSGLTTLATFGVMLFSSLPGQRQLAVYAMSGIAVSLVLSLVVLPHLVRPASAVLPFRSETPDRRRLSRPWVLGVWLLLLVVGAWQSTRLTFDGDLRRMNMVPPGLRETEQALQQTWGDLRGRAIAFVEGREMETALAGNEQLFAHLAARLPAADVISVAPLLPSAATQERNLAQWRAFWQGPQGTSILQNLENEADRIGFSREAFAPFRQRCVEGPAADGRQGDPVAGALADTLVVREENRVRILTLLPDTAEVAALFDGAAALPAGARLVSQRRFNGLISSAIGSDFRQYLLSTLLVVTGVVILIFRSLRKILLTMVPVVTGMMAMTGGMGWLGIPFNLFNIVATVLVIGLCIDYGIYMVCRLTEGADYDADRAVLVSGLTTLAGFGVLVMASHPALHSIGVTVLFGISAAIPAALLVIPALERR